jgi:hypothetical protein
MQHVLNIQYGYLFNKYIKCTVWRLAVRYDTHTHTYIYMSLGGKGLKSFIQHLAMIFSMLQHVVSL